MAILRIRPGIAIVLASTALAGCTAVSKNPELPAGPAAYALMPGTIPARTSYEIAPSDTLAINVFNEPALTFEKLRVDDAGFIQLPLVGQFKAAGKSPLEVSQAIAEVLGRRYLVDPQVSISVVEAAPRYVSVEGEVKKPGVYEVDYDTTLLSAIARAESPQFTARLDQVIIFRTINGQRMAARFDLKKIRGGIDADPIVLDGDVVMVGYSGARGAWRDFLQAAPLFNVFAVAANNNN